MKRIFIGAKATFIGGECPFIGTKINFIGEKYSFIGAKTAFIGTEARYSRFSFKIIHSTRLYNFQSTKKPLSHQSEKEVVNVNIKLTF